ncbi:hypothetical protein QTP88_027902 [Uroleucon formosanum]
MTSIVKAFDVLHSRQSCINVFSKFSSVILPLFLDNTALPTLKIHSTATLLDSGVLNFTITFLIVGVSIKESKPLVGLLVKKFDISCSKGRVNFDLFFDQSKKVFVSSVSDDSYSDKCCCSNISKQDCLNNDKAVSSLSLLLSQAVLKYGCESVADNKNGSLGCLLKRFSTLFLSTVTKKLIFFQIEYHHIFV